VGCLSPLLSFRQTRTFICRKVTRHMLKPIYSNISGENKHAATAALQLLAQVAGTSVSAARELAHHFDFSLKSLPHLARAAAPRHDPSSAHHRLRVPDNRLSLPASLPACHLLTRLCCCGSPSTRVHPVLCGIPAYRGPRSRRGSDAEGVVCPSMARLASRSSSPCPGTASISQPARPLSSALPP